LSTLKISCAQCGDDSVDPATLHCGHCNGEVFYDNYRGKQRIVPTFEQLQCWSCPAQSQDDLDHGQMP
jgi:hypothetical protein